MTLQHAWQDFELPDMKAKSVILDAFIGRSIDAPQHLGKVVAGNYFEPTIEDLQPRTIWSLVKCFHIGLRTNTADARNRIARVIFWPKFNRGFTLKCPNRNWLGLFLLEDEWPVFRIYCKDYAVLNGSLQSS